MQQQRQPEEKFIVPQLDVHYDRLTLRSESSYNQLYSEIAKDYHYQQNLISEIAFNSPSTANTYRATKFPRQIPTYENSSHLVHDTENSRFKL